MAIILVVDDRPESRYPTARILEQAGYDVRETGTGHDALRLARGLPPDLIVLDVVLPDQDGFAVCRHLKSDHITRAIPVILKTAVYWDEKYRDRGLEAGAADYLMEPVEPAALVAVVARLLKPSS